MEDYFRNNQGQYNKLKIEYDKLKSQEILYKKQLATMEQQKRDDAQKIEELKQKLSALQDMLIDYMNRQEKAQNIIESTQNLKELETQRLKLLYQKWEDLFDGLRAKNASFFSLDELVNFSSDFRHALKVVVDDSLASPINDKSYAKSVLNKMAGTSGQNKQIKKYVARSVTKKQPDFTAQVFEEELVVSQTESEAEKFLNGKQTFIPKSMGVGKEVLTIPPKEQKQEKQGFSLEEALTPKESLSEIMSVFKLDD